MLAAAILRRHLMVWKIFAPRFVFEAVNFLFVILAVSFAYVLMISVHYALDIWIKKINRT